MSKTKVILLGTGNPNPDPSHLGPALIILVDQTPYIVDFGAGLIRQAASLTSHYGGNLKELEIKNLKTAFLTHMHSDHTLGYADLILTPWVMGRDTPLVVYGPDGLIEITKKPIGIKMGGIMQFNLREIDVECLPTQIPSSIELDAGSVEIGHSIHVSDLPEQEGIKIMTDPKKVILLVTEPMIEEEPAEEAEGEAAEPELVKEKGKEGEEEEKKEEKKEKEK